MLSTQMAFYKLETFLCGCSLNRCLAVLEDVWEADVVGAVCGVGFDVVVTTTIRCVVVRRVDVYVTLASHFVDGSGR